jgi:dihydrofolate reductase
VHEASAASSTWAVARARGTCGAHLVEELRLMIYPVVLGAGERLFGKTSDTKPMRLVHVQTVGDSLALLTYQPARDA